MQPKFMISFKGLKFILIFKRVSSIHAKAPAVKIVDIAQPIKSYCCYIFIIPKMEVCIPSLGKRSFARLALCVPCKSDAFARVI